MKSTQPTTINKRNCKLVDRNENEIVSVEWEESKYIPRLTNFSCMNFYGRWNEHTETMTKENRLWLHFVHLADGLFVSFVDLFLWCMSFSSWSVDRNILVVICDIRLFKIECMDIGAFFTLSRDWFGVCSCDFVQCYSHSIVSSILCVKTTIGEYDIIGIVW